MNYTIKHATEEHHFYVGTSEMNSEPYKVVFFSQSENMLCGIAIWKADYDATARQLHYVKLHQSSVDRSPSKELAEQYLRYLLENKLP